MNTTKANAKQTWNDQFEEFMHQPVDKKKSKSGDKSKKADEDGAETAEKADGSEEAKKPAESQNELVDDKRLFVMNLSYTVTKEELQELFGKYGQIDDIEIPFRKGGRGTPLGLGFVRFSESESAIQAFAELDQIYYQGRKLHIKPAEKKPPKPEEEMRERPAFERREDGQQSNYKKEKEAILKTNFDDETNWNYLYMN